MVRANAHAGNGEPSAMLAQLPNLLTLSRILVLPPLIACLWIGGETFRWVALGLYALASITDYLDGYLARTLKAQSAFGRLLDPIADKLLVGACLLILSALHYISGWTVLAALVILLREILVSGLREFLAEIRIGMPVSRLAKWKTTVQLLAIGFLIIGGDAPAWTRAQLIGEVGLWLAAGFTLVTGWDYLRSGLGHLADQDRDRVKPGVNPARTTS
jgi:CDP-diacylglycerol--glycerol-3-phosphate 3-phosphatidyltransferase